MLYHTYTLKILKMGKFIGRFISPGISVLILIIFALASCQSNKNRTGGEDFGLDSTDISEDLMSDINNAKQIFYSLPSPLETAMLIKTAGADYNQDLLNPVSNAGNYTTNRSKALNLGIYTTDLSFASLFDQTQTSIQYMNAAKVLADGLGILDAIDANTIEQLEENINNRDRIMDIISDTFMNSSSFLTENDRPALASIVLVGGWGEGLYIATNLVGDQPIEDNKLVERIVDQKLSFNIVINLLDENKENEDVANLLIQIDDLKQTFDKISIKTGPIKAVPDEESNVTVLKSESKIKITPEIFKELTDKVKVLRTNFIS